VKKISLFTPTHNGKYLRELYNSIKNQDFYEWVIITNNTTIENFEDSRIKIYEYNNSHFVGALKRFACEKCVGDVLVEIDHDDLLTENAIEEIRKAFEDDEIGFVYSNCVEFKNDFEPILPYNKNHGWEYREFNYKRHVLNENISFESLPNSVSKIWYAPNHVRAWRTLDYWKAGGHSAELKVLDDQDLISRTYLITKFKHINKCLYLYRITQDNTWQIHNKEIQEGVYPLYHKYIYKLVTRWAEINNLRKLDLGGRFNNPKNYETVDLENANINTDLNERWPFEDNSIGVIRAHDILEHLKNPIHTMKEAHRVLVPGGYFMIMVPSTDGRGAFQDCTHISYFNENSFWYYTKNEQAKYIGKPVRFQAMALTTGVPSQWHQINKIPYVYAHLIALKGQKTIGLIEI